MTTSATAALSAPKPAASSVADTLLNINVDELFEQFTIADIDRIHKQLQTDVELKKVELRTMVGERYRDLLQAADTIADMRRTSSSVSAHIDGVSAACRRLQERQLLGFRAIGSPSHQPTPLPAGLQHFHALGVQVRLLAALPELIWTRLERDDYFVAAQLFALARHISTGLQLDVQRAHMQRFPVAQRLWDSLRPMHGAMRSACVRALGRQALTTGTAAKCLASLLLLDAGTSVDRLLGTFVQLRAQTFVEALAAAKPAGGDGGASKQRIRQRILASLDVQTDTVRLLYDCFVAGEVAAEVDALRRPDAPPTVALVPLAEADPLLRAKLPAVIAQFRPHMQSDALPAAALRERVQQWLRLTSDDCGRQLQQTVDGVASVQTVHRIRCDALARPKPDRWPERLAGLQLPAEWDPYRQQYEPLIDGRVRSIVWQQWRAIGERMRSDVAGLLEQENRAAATGGAHADKWRPDGRDVPASLQQALSTEPGSHRLQLRANGYSERIGAVCARFDEQLRAVHEDVRLYVHGLVDEAPSEDADQQSIVACLQRTSAEAMTELLAAIRTIDAHRSNAASIALATLLRALTDLCPHLRRCLQQHWDATVVQLQDASLHFWTEWCERFVAEQAPHFGPTDAQRSGQMAADVLAWDAIRVDVRDEQDRPVECALRVPAQPSVELQRFWHGVCTALLGNVPYALPRSVTRALADRLTEHVRQVYEQRAGQPLVAVQPNAALQTYFDVRFVQLVFVGRDCRTTADAWSALVGRCKALIDPFDFELMHRHLMANVRAAIQRMQHKLGVLIADGDRLVGVLAALSAGGADNRDPHEPNVLALSGRADGGGYFTLLPVQMTAEKTKANEV